MLFDGFDQIDLTEQFKVLSRIPNSTYRLYGRTTDAVRDVKSLRLTPDATLGDAPRLDVLHVPGGFGKEALMEDEYLLVWIRRQATGAHSVFSICTGALLLGAAGLLKGRRATTHWASFHLLPYFGAIPVNERVVVDGNWVFAAGVTAGIDFALALVAMLFDEKTAQAIQLRLEYNPAPPFNAGSPYTAPAEVVALINDSIVAHKARRAEAVARAATRLTENA